MAANALAADVAELLVDGGSGARTPGHANFRERYSNKFEPKTDA